MQLSELKGQLLLATPALMDPHFHDGVVLLCHHDKEGSMGLIVNRTHHVSVDSVLSDLHLKHATMNAPTYEGGPVEPFRGFVLHDSNRIYKSTLSVTSEISLTTSLDILEEIAAGTGPDQFLLILGYAGWESGQLEEEIGRNDWLIAPADQDIIFHAPVENRWELGAKSVGIDKAQLSMQAGHA